MRMFPGLVILLAVGCAGASGGPGDTGEPRQAARHGEELYQRYCSSCHGVDAQGGGPVAAVLEVAPPDLTRIAARNGGKFPENAILRTIDGRDPVIAHGSRDMPIWGERFVSALAPSADKAAAQRGTILVIVEYLREIQR